MFLCSSIKDMLPARPCCVTIGNFDGVHAGHQALIARAREISRQEQLDFLLITFWPHPRLALAGPEAHKPLTTRELRLRLLEEAGVDKVLEIEFTPAFAATSAGDFVRTWLLPLNLRHLVVGHDFSLGHRREGNINRLRELGNEYNFQTTRLPVLEIDNVPVSSTLLRRYIETGDVQAVQILLGRPYRICGIVGHGFERGRKLGFPTANLENVATLLPGDGVYATFAFYNGTKYPAVTNIGKNPTFGGGKRTIESFLLEGEPELYNKELCLDFVSRLRGECKFTSPEALAAQIRKDVEQARSLLVKAG